MTTNELLTLIVAGYGAVVSTGVALWQIVTWRIEKIPNVKLRAIQVEDVEIPGESRARAEARGPVWIVTVHNIGRIPVTVRQVGAILKSGAKGSFFIPNFKTETIQPFAQKNWFIHTSTPVCLPAGRKSKGDWQSTTATGVVASDVSKIFVSVNDDREFETIVANPGVEKVKS